MDLYKWTKVTSITGDENKISPLEKTCKRKVRKRNHQQQKKSSEENHRITYSWKTI